VLAAGIGEDLRVDEARIELRVNARAAHQWPVDADKLQNHSATFSATAKKQR
jgi:hypothetical protein